MLQLFKACSSGDEGSVKSILASESGLDLNQKDGEGLGLLHHAVYNNHPNLVELLLNKKEVCLAVTSDHNGGTALHGDCYFNFVPIGKTFQYLF